MGAADTMTTPRPQRRKIRGGNDRLAAFYVLKHPGTVYVEGWVVFPNGIVTARAWVEEWARGDDGTLVRCVHDVSVERAGVADAWKGCTYFAGLRWKAAELDTALTANGDQVPLHDGDGGGPKYRDADGWHQAWHDAWHHVRERVPCGVHGVTNCTEDGCECIYCQPRWWQ